MLSASIVIFLLLFASSYSTFIVRTETKLNNLMLRWSRKCPHSLRTIGGRVDRFYFLGPNINELFCQQHRNSPETRAHHQMLRIALSDHFRIRHVHSSTP